MTTDERLAELTQEVANHLSGRPVEIRWRNPPSKFAAGQVVKSLDNRLIVYVANLTDADSRLKVLLHELSHAANDFDFIPVTGERASGSVRQSPEARKIWREDNREIRAKKQADEWMDHAELYAYKYWQVGRSKMECQLLALLDIKTGESI